jgi:hypothetical protein
MRNWQWAMKGDAIGFMKSMKKGRKIMALKSP